MDKAQKTALTSLLVEVGIAAVLVLLILLTLNYFNILPLSSTFSFLSFLPQQTQSGVNNLSQLSGTSGPGINTRSVIFPSSPQKIANGSDKVLFTLVKNSFVKPTGTLRIDAELVDSRGVLGKGTATEASGLTFKNNLKFQDSNYRHLRIFYLPKGQNWLLESRENNASKFAILKHLIPTSLNFIKATLFIDAEGKAVTVLVDGRKSKTIQLQSSLYAGGNQMNIMAQVAPQSELDMYGLYYQY